MLKRQSISYLIKRWKHGKDHWVSLSVEFFFFLPQTALRIYDLHHKPHADYILLK